MTSAADVRSTKDSDTASMASNSTFASTITLIKEKMHRRHKSPKAPKAPKGPKEQPQKKLLLADVATGAHRTRKLLPHEQK